MLWAVIILFAVCLWLVVGGIITRRAHNDLYDMVIRHINETKNTKEASDLMADSLECMSNKLQKAISELRQKHEP